ncbi:MAG: LacI family transcriptional regulator [Tepidisphaera sp.]|jgi:LacI family transcriptional regulator
MASVRGIAAQVGVSVATVSRALNNHPHVDAETRRKVVAAAGRAGYTPGNAGRRVSTAIGLVYPGEVVRADYGGFDASLLAGVLRGLNEHKLDIQIVSVGRDKGADETFAEFFVRKGLRGVILRNFEETRSMTRAIAAEGFPAVVVADRFDDESVNFVWCDSRSDSRRAVQHLIDLGHRRIALGVHRVPDTDHHERRAGYREALKEAGIAEDPSIMVDICGDMEGGAAYISRLLSLPVPPTAVYFSDPLATVGALRRCLELGLSVPRDLSIIGFDDSDIRKHTFPQYSAVVQDAEMVGFEAARWLSRRLAHPEDPQWRNLRMERSTFLEINKTTGRPPVEPVRVLPDGTRVAVKV